MSTPTMVGHHAQPARGAGRTPGRTRRGPGDECDPHRRFAVSERNTDDAAEESGLGGTYEVDTSDVRRRNYQNRKNWSVS